MPDYSFTVFEVDSSYLYGDMQSPILSQDELTISDTDSRLHASNIEDPGSDQTFDFASEPAVTDYDITFLDRAQVNGSGPKYKLFSMEVRFSDGSTKYYVMSKDPNFEPNIGDDLRVTNSNFFTSTNYSDIGAMICFTPGTRILTPTGQRLIEDLKVGDEVDTLDHGPQPVRWIGNRRLGPRQLKANPRLHPILISPHVFGNDQALLVSPQHRMLVECQSIGWNSGHAQGLIRAKHVAEHLGRAARIARGVRSVTYIHLLFERHEIIWAEGAATESLYPGPMALAGMPTEDQEEITALFPDAPLDRTGMVAEAPVSLARPIVPNHAVKAFGEKLSKSPIRGRDLRLGLNGHLTKVTARTGASDDQGYLRMVSSAA